MSRHSGINDSFENLVGFEHRRVFEDRDSIIPPDNFTGVWEVLWPNGVICSRTCFLKGAEHGPFLCLWHNGNLAQVGMHLNGKSLGVWTDYREDGSKMLEGVYGSKGREGVWLWFGPDGEVKEEIHYRGGKKIQSTIIDSLD